MTRSGRACGCCIKNTCHPAVLLPAEAKRSQGISVRLALADKASWRPSKQERLQQKRSDESGLGGDPGTACVAVSARIARALHVCALLSWGPHAGGGRRPEVGGFRCRFLRARALAASHEAAAEARGLTAVNEHGAWSHQSAGWPRTPEYERPAMGGRGEDAFRWAAGAKSHVRMHEGSSREPIRWSTSGHAAQPKFKLVRDAGGQARPARRIGV